jgi:nicotinamide riboside kinase
MQIKKIVVVGAESTGKSTLCKELADFYRTQWVPEYAREWLTRQGMDYRFEDLVVIAKGQVESEEATSCELEAASCELRASSQTFVGGEDGYRLLFIDTDMYVMKVWSEFVFGRCDTWILDQIVKRKYDGYLLCRSDLPWSPDPLREYPDSERREKLFHIYRDCLINQPAPWAEIGGSGKTRLDSAIQAVDEMTHAVAAG